MLSLLKTKKPVRASLAALTLLALGSAVPIAGQEQGLYTVSAPQSVDEATLRAAIDPMFDDSEMGETRALLVLRDGDVIAERYAPGYGPDSLFLSWSVAKTITAVLVGLLVSDGRLVLDDPAPVAPWGQAGDPRGAITLRQLLQMRSGLEHIESGDPLAQADTIRMLFLDGASDMGAYAEAKPLAHKPGTTFDYSTATSVILSDMMTRALTDSADPKVRRDAMMQFVTGRLIQPVGLNSLTPEFDAAGTMIGGSIMHATTRDYAKFGEFLRNRGRAEGRQVLSPRWVDFMTAPSARHEGYGGHLWLNRNAAADTLFPDAAPASVFAAVGHHGQYIIVAPSKRLTIVRLGVSTTEQRVPLRAALARLIDVFPGS